MRVQGSCQSAARATLSVKVRCLAAVWTANFGAAVPSHATAIGTVAVRSELEKSSCRARVMRVVYRVFGGCLASTSELLQL